MKIAHVLRFLINRSNLHVLGKKPFEIQKLNLLPLNTTKTFDLEWLREVRTHIVSSKIVYHELPESS